MRSLTAKRRTQHTVLMCEKRVLRPQRGDERTEGTSYKWRFLHAPLRGLVEMTNRECAYAAWRNDKQYKTSRTKKYHPRWGGIFILHASPCNAFHVRDGRCGGQGGGRLRRGALPCGRSPVRGLFRQPRKGAVRPRVDGIRRNIIGTGEGF